MVIITHQAFGEWLYKILINVEIEEAVLLKSKGVLPSTRGDFSSIVTIGSSSFRIPNVFLKMDSFEFFRQVCLLK